MQPVADATLDLGRRGRGRGAAHGKTSSPQYALRLRAGGNVVAYARDTAWSEALVEASRRAGPVHLRCVLLREADQAAPELRDPARARARLECRRLILTHLGGDLLAHRAEVAEEVAEDGLPLVL
jgi:ribonuclease BN (tRNA processing enzyme)